MSEPDTADKDEEMAGPTDTANMDAGAEGLGVDEPLTVESLQGVFSYQICTNLLTRFKAALKELQEERDCLKAQLTATSAESSSAADDMVSIPRPRGTAGSSFSIQESMNLAGSEKKDRIYRALQVYCLCHHSALDI